jgi:hypothetical protein
MNVLPLFPPSVHDVGRPEMESKASEGSQRCVTTTRQDHKEELARIHWRILNQQLRMAQKFNSIQIEFSTGNHVWPSTLQRLRPETAFLLAERAGTKKCRMHRRVAVVVAPPLVYR